MNASVLDRKLISIKPPKLNNVTREELSAYFDNTWALYETLFSSIRSDETLYQSPDPLRNPLIFYLGHTAAFYVNKLKLGGLIEKGVNEKFDNLFAVGVDPDLPQNLHVSAYWPTIEETRTYRKTIYKLVHQVINKADLSDLPIHEYHPLWALYMALEHDRIHFETSSMLIRQLHADLVKRPSTWKYAPSLGDAPKNEWIEMSENTIQIGKPKHSDIYGWDNEFGTLTTNVAPFKATKNLMTNSDFLSFVHDGGYQNKDFWTEEGWDWRTRTNTDCPKFWIPTVNGYLYRAMFDELAMPMDWPVEVNAHEAQAYCSWKNDGSRLLSEAEFLAIARENTMID